MKTILRIDSSIRTVHSVSRRLTDEFIATWREHHPGDRIVERDLAISPVPHLTEQAFAAAVTPGDARTDLQSRDAALSDELIHELIRADVLVLGAPMYNLSVSSSLKAWIDHIARAGVTFSYSESGPRGLLSGKKAYVFTSRGGIYSHGPGKAMDFHETYLRGVLGFVGISDIAFLHSEGLALGPKVASEAIAQTRASMAELIAA